MGAPIPPSGAAMRRAWQGGLRPRSRGLTAGVACLALAAAFSRAGAESLDPWRQLLIEPRSAPRLLFCAAVWVSAAALALELLIAGVAGLLGPVRRVLARGVPRAALSASPVLVAVLWLVGLWILHPWLVDAAAGGARAVDASGSALASLWHTWALRVVTITGLVLVGAGIVELQSGRRRLWRALHLTVAEARRERRQGPG